MDLFAKIKNDTLEAMKSSDKFKLSVLRMLKSAIQTEQINKKHDLDDNEIISVVKHQVKLRKDSKNEYEKYDRPEEVANLKKEIELLSIYLPEELTDEKVNEILDEIFKEINPTSIKDMGLLMKKASEKMGNAADMGKVSALIKSRLLK